jgi:DNA gyrase subunit A
VIKKTALSAYSHPRAAGVNAVNLREGDALVEALLTSGNDEILIAAREGRCCRFNESDAREMGRTSTGVRGINIDETDEVIGAINYDPQAEDAADHTVLVVSEHGFGKRTDFDEYRITKRGGKGVKTINITEKTGKLIAIKNVTENDDLMIIEKSGLTIRLSVSEIRIAGRATQGVKLINIKDGDSIAAVSSVAKNEDNEPEQSGDADPQETPDAQN